jgi:phage major head subunit gpT-like protein
MPTLTPSQIRAINTFVDTGIMSGRRQVQPNWQAAAKKVSQSNGTGTYAWMNDIPNIVKKQLPGYARAGVSSSSFQVYSEEQGLFLEIAARDVRDDNVGVYQNLPAALGRRIEEFPQRNVWRLFKEGDQSTFESRSILAHDGLSFFNDSHLTDGRTSGGGTYDNSLASTALSKANFEVALAAMAVFPDQNGEVMNQKPTHLIVPPQLAVTGADILQAMTISTGGTNTSSAEYLRLRGQNPIELVIVPELSGDSTTWYLTCMSDERAPMIWQETEAISVISLTDPRDPNMVNDNMLVWAAKGESGFAFADPRCAIRCVA